MVSFDKSILAFPSNFIVSFFAVRPVISIEELPTMLKSTLSPVIGLLMSIDEFPTCLIFRKVGIVMIASIK